MRLHWAILVIAAAGSAAAQPFTVDSPGIREIWGLVEGQAVSPDTLKTISQQAGSVVYRHARLPVEIEAQYRAWGETGVITRDLAVVNRGSEVAHIEHLPSLHWRLPKGEYSLTYLYGGWGQERQVATEKLGAGRRAFISDRGRSTALYSPWFYLHNDTTGMGYLGQLAWSGNWEMTFERHPGASNSPLSDQELTVELGMRFDFGGALALEPGERFELPRVAISTTRRTNLRSSSSIRGTCSSTR
jgi:alpha-galactosidase